MSQNTFVIDLQKCSGCGACAIACKTENNTPNREKNQSFNWCDVNHRSSGKFPNFQQSPMPVRCNHCTDAPCIEGCPVTPKAMYKNEDGVTMHNDERCIGCRMCQTNCPYSEKEVGFNEWSVISFNDRGKVPHNRYKDNVAVIAGCTTTGAEIADSVGATPPHANLFANPDYDAVRKPGVVEKCMFCVHRTDNGEDPYCVVSCPAGARTYGDRDDPTSKAHKLLAKYDAEVLKPEAGTSPNVYYIRSFKVESK